MPLRTAVEAALVGAKRRRNTFGVVERSDPLGHRACKHGHALPSAVADEARTDAEHPSRARAADAVVGAHHVEDTGRVCTVTERALEAGESPAGGSDGVQAQVGAADEQRAA